MLGTAQVPEVGARSQEPVAQPSAPPIRPRAVALATAGYLVLAVLAFRPLLPWNGTDMPASGDPYQMLWFLGWAPWWVAHFHNPFFTDLIGYPTGVNLATNTTVMPLGVLVAPLTHLAGPIASWNLLARLSIVSSALSLCLVVRRWTRWWPAAFLAGLLYGFGPYMQFEAGSHLDLLFLAFPPLILLLVDDLLVGQRRPTIRTGLFLGCVVVLQFLINAEILLDCGIVTVVTLLVIALVHREAVTDHLRVAWRGIVTAAAVIVSLGAYPLWALLAGPGRVNGPTRPEWDLSDIYADLLSPVRHGIQETIDHFRTKTVLVPGQPGQPGHTMTHAVPVAFHWSSPLGFVGIPLLLLLAIMTVAWRRESVLRVGVLVGLIAFVCSLGPRLTIDGHVTSIPLPAAVFARVPLLWNIVPLRFSALVALGAALVLAVGLDRTRGWVAAEASRIERRSSHWTIGRDGHDRADLRPMEAQHDRGVPRVLISAVVIVITLAVMVPLVLRYPLVRERPVADMNTGSFIAARTPPAGVVLTVPYVDAPDNLPMVWQAQADMSFKLLGADAITPGPPGTHSGTVSAPLPLILHPLRAVTGRVKVSSNRANIGREGQDHRLAVARQDERACDGLSTGLESLDVSTVVVYRAPTIRFRIAERLLTAALGPPSAQIEHRGLLLWARGSGWLRPSDCTSLDPVPATRSS